MTRDECRYLLRSLPPGGVAEAAHQEALQHALSDPELAAWLARQQSCDRAIAGRLSALEPPAHLRSAILVGAAAGARVSRGGSRLVRYALAACLTVALVTGALLFSSRRVQDRERAAYVNMALLHARSGAHGGHGKWVAAAVSRCAQPGTSALRPPPNPAK